MYRRAVFDPRIKKWDTSFYMLRDRPSDGKLVPMLTPVGCFNTEGQVRTPNRIPSTPTLDSVDCFQAHVDDGASGDNLSSPYALCRRIKSRSRRLWLRPANRLGRETLTRGQSVGQNRRG